MLSEIKYNVMMQHPRGSKDGVRIGAVVFEGVAPAVPTSLVVEVGPRLPRRRNIPAEGDSDIWESRKPGLATWDAPACPRVLRPAAVVHVAVLLDCSRQSSVVLSGHVGVGRAAVYDCVAEARAYLGATQGHPLDNDRIVRAA